MNFSANIAGQILFSVMKFSRHGETAAEVSICRDFQVNHGDLLLLCGLYFD